MAATIRAIIFDLDDTLYAERDYVASGFKAVAEAFAKELGRPARTVRQLGRLFESSQRKRVFDGLLAERGWSDTPQTRGLIQKMIDAYHTHAPAIHLHPDADDALTRLKGRYKLGLITDGPPAQQRAKIDALGLDVRLDAVVLTGELGSGYGKPNTAAYALMADRLGEMHEQCLYVGDNPAKDFLGPNVLGWNTVQVVRADGIYRDVAAPPGGSPHQRLDSLSELDALLDRSD